MKSIKRIVICLTIVSGIITGCKKSDNSTKSSSSNPLFQGSWKLTKFEIKTSGGAWIQVDPPSLLAGEVFTFKADGTYVIYSGGLYSSTSNWSVYDNGQSISLAAFSYHIAVLNSITMQLVNENESFAYNVNGNASTYYGERDTYGH